MQQPAAVFSFPSSDLRIQGGMHCQRGFMPELGRYSLQIADLHLILILISAFSTPSSQNVGLRIQNKSESPVPPLLCCWLTRHMTLIAGASPVSTNACILTPPIMLENGAQSIQNTQWSPLHLLPDNYFNRVLRCSNMPIRLLLVILLNIMKHTRHDPLLPAFKKGD